MEVYSARIWNSDFCLCYVLPGGHYFSCNLFGAVGGWLVFFFRLKKSSGCKMKASTQSSYLPQFPAAVMCWHMFVSVWWKRRSLEMICCECMRSGSPTCSFIRSMDQIQRCQLSVDKWLSLALLTFHLALLSLWIFNSSVPRLQSPSPPTSILPDILGDEPYSDKLRVREEDK